MTDSAPRNKRRRSSKRPDEILDAALALFVEKGFAFTTVDEIAARARLSKGAVYLYFASKEALLEGLVLRAVAPIASLAAADLGAADVSKPREVLSRVLSRLVVAMSDEKTLAVPMLVIREAPNTPSIAAIYRDQILAHVLPALANLIDGARRRGAIRDVDPELTVRSIIGPVIAHMILARVFGVVPDGGLEMQRLVENHVDILFNGLSPRGAPQ